MPIQFEIQSAEGKFLKKEEPAVPVEFRFVRDYFFGELKGIIGAQCLSADMGGVVHIVNDPEMLVAITEGEDVAGLLGDETAAVGIYPEGEPVKFPFTTMRGHLGNLAIYHTFPELPPVYN